jgi:ribose-phosphate pyrophosphokinase
VKEEKCTKIKVLSVAELFAVAIRNAYENKSITSLFIHSQRRDLSKRNRGEETTTGG